MTKSCFSPVYLQEVFEYVEWLVLNVHLQDAQINAHDGDQLSNRQKAMLQLRMSTHHLVSESNFCTSQVWLEISMQPFQGHQTNGNPRTFFSISSRGFPTLPKN